MKTTLLNLLAVVCVLFSQSTFATTYTSNGSGNISSISWTPSGTPGSTDDIIIRSTDIVSLNANITYNSIVVNGIMYTSTYVVSGGSFTLSSGGSLGIGSADGITSSGSTGNIQTTSRSFSTSANYIYSGTVQQQTGSGLPSVVNELTIDNNSTDSGIAVELTNAVDITSTLILIDGILGADTSGSTSNTYIRMKLGSSFDYNEDSVFTVNGSTYYTRGDCGYSPSWVVGPIQVEYTGGPTCFKIPTGTFSDTGYRPLGQCLRFNGSATNILEYRVISPTKDINNLKKGLDSINRHFYYHTNEINVSSSYLQQDISLYWYPYDNYSYTSLLQGAEYNDNKSTWEIMNSTKVLTGTASSGSVKLFNNSQTREDYTIGFGGVALPVNLLSFEATLVGADVQLYWRTASEVNANYFTIEKSVDGVNFDQILTVEAKGESTEISDYQEMDPFVGTGIVYYQLNLVDFEGNSEIVGIRSIVREEINIEVYPNPAKDQISIEFNEAKGDSRISVIDLKGAELINTSVSLKGKSNHSINLSSLPKGIYLVRVQNNQSVISKKIQVL